MPHIIIKASDMNCNVQKISIHATVRFSKEYYHRPKCYDKMSQLEDDLLSIVEKYFPTGVTSEVLSNHEFNLNDQMKYEQPDK